MKKAISDKGSENWWYFLMGLGIGGAAALLLGLKSERGTRRMSLRRRPHGRYEKSLPIFLAENGRRQRTSANGRTPW